MNDPPDSTGTKYFIPTGPLTASVQDANGETALMLDKDLMYQTFSKDSKQREQILRRDSSQEIYQDEGGSVILPLVSQSVPQSDYLKILQV